MTNGIIFWICFNISHFSSAECFWSDVEKNTKRIRWRKSHSKVETNDEFDRAKQWKGSISAIIYCIRKPAEKLDTKVKVLWVRKMRNTIERRDPLFALKEERTDPLYTHTHQATQNGMLIKLGLLKSGNLMNWWMIERWDPLFALRERINSLLKTTKQNQNCR